MDEIFSKVKKGQRLTLEATYEVMEVDPNKMSFTLRNIRTDATNKHTDWYLHNIRQLGFSITLTD